RLRADIEDRVASDVDASHLRLKDPLRQVAADLRDRIANVIHGPVGGRADLELDKGPAIAFGDAAVDLVNAVHAADRGFDPLRDLRFHLVRGGARLDNHDLGGREVDVRV